MERSTAVEEADFVLIAGIVATSTWDLGAEFCLEDQSPAFLAGCLRPLTDEDLQLPIGSLLLTLVDARKTTFEEGEPLATAWMAGIDQRWHASTALGVAGAAAQSELLPWLDGIDRALEQSPLFDSLAAESDR